MASKNRAYSFLNENKSSKSMHQSTIHFLQKTFDDLIHLQNQENNELKQDQINKENMQRKKSQIIQVKIVRDQAWMENHQKVQAKKQQNNYNKILNQLNHKQKLEQIAEENRKEKERRKRQLIQQEVNHLMRGKQSINEIHETKQIKNEQTKQIYSQRKERIRLDQSQYCETVNKKSSKIKVYLINQKQIDQMKEEELMLVKKITDLEIYQDYL